MKAHPVLPTEKQENQRGHRPKLFHLRITVSGEKKNKKKKKRKRKKKTHKPHKHRKEKIVNLRHQTIRFTFMLRGSQKI